MSSLPSGLFNMKRIKNLSAHFVLLLLSTCISVYGQQKDGLPSAEKVGLMTDRTLYIAGEQVQFSALITSEMQTEWSKILYVEIITPDGKKVVENKFPIRNTASHGCLTIPAENITGNYYIRAYTKYMRNAGPDAYAYVAIKIINPQSNEVLTNTDLTIVNSDERIRGEQQDDAFIISTDKNEYGSGEKVNVTIALNNPLVPLSGGRGQNMSGDRGQMVSASVVPESSSVGFRRNQAPSDSASSSIDFYPETRGVSITGQLRDGATGNPVANGRVNLSIIGQGRDFEAMQTDSAGRYFFSLPDYTGFRDIFLCAEKDSLAKPILLVDNDFCSVPVHLPSPEFRLSPEERTAAYTMARNAQVAKYFNPDTMPCSNKNETSENAFYGKPNDVLVFDKFVQLPTLEEYFNELPSAVRVRKQNGHKYFKVIGERAEMNFFNPLVMVDWVAVNNPEKILAASPNNIARIEVITVPYVKGNITYGGIVSIISKKGDFAGIDLPQSGIFFNYLFLADTCHCQRNLIEYPESPDTRNTLYWNSDLALDANQRAEFSFKTPATPGKYNIVLKGIESDGEVYEQRAEFVVKKEE
jgi:hypothetical protein